MVWFKRLGPVFGPVSVAGRVLGLVALGFCRQVFLVVDGKSHSVADTLYGVFPYWAAAFLGWTWIAKADPRQSRIRDFGVDTTRRGHLPNFKLIHYPGDPSVYLEKPP